MKTTIKSIEITDFKGISHELINFDEKENLIEKPNGSGKTSIYDAFCWVVFSKNSEQSSRFNIAPVGVEKPKTKVVIVMDVDGTEIVLEKTVGKWKYNGLEVNKSVFEDFLANIYNVETLEFLANPLAFMNLHWETRRNYLTGLFCEKVSEDSEFSFLMKSMQISDIRKSKTKQKKDASDGMKRSGIIIETHEKNLEEIQKQDFTGMKTELSEKTAELENLSNFDWQNFHAKETRMTSAVKDLNGLVAQWKETDSKRSIEDASKYEDSKGCSQCGSKITQANWDKLKLKKLEDLNKKLAELQSSIIEKRASNKTQQAEFDALVSTKPNEETAAKVRTLSKETSDLKIALSKESEIASTETKINEEQKRLDVFAKEVLDIEAFMDRFSTFLETNYYKSINDNFKGLFFDIEDECRLTNENGTEFKDFSMSEKINAGVQIVSVISEKIGVKFPLWIDNRESVSELYPIDTQIINLKVLENDKPRRK